MKGLGPLSDDEVKIISKSSYMEFTKWNKALFIVGHRTPYH